MSSNLKYTGLAKKYVEIPAYAVATIEYNETLPNYYRVQNCGTNRIFCGTSHIPTPERYDFAVGGEKVKLYGEPYNKNNLYILNPSGSTIGVTVTSFAAPFDPSTMALSDLELDLSSTTLETSTVISGFNSPLPAGDNKIGKVEVINPDSAAIEYVGDRVEYGNTLAAYISKEYEKLLSGTASTVGVYLDADDGYRLCEVCFLSNDGTSDISATFNYEGTTQNIVVKAGEVLNNCRCYCDSIKITGNGVPFRLFAVERKKV